MNKFILFISFFFIFFPPPEIPIPPNESIIAEALSITAPKPTATPMPTPTSVPTLYSTFTEEELNLLFKVVEAEATEGGLEEKTNVASVIFNRVRTGWSDGDLISILLSPRQFEVITNGRYKRVKVTETTILACEFAFENDTVDGAIYFDCTNGESWAAQECKKGNLIWVMKDGIGHDFYRKKRKGE